MSWEKYQYTEKKENYGEDLYFLAIKLKKEKLINLNTNELSLFNLELTYEANP